MEQEHQYQAEDFLYDKQIDCPLCDQKTALRVVKRSTLRLAGRDSDSMPTYKFINPLFYDVWQCNHCGYAALEGYFTREIAPDDKKVLLQEVAARWIERTFPGIYESGMALNRYKIALYCTNLRRSDQTEITLLYLKMAWIYRTKHDQGMEARCLALALEGFKSLYEVGHFPVAGMDESALIYMIADLCNRTADNQQSLRWLEMVLTNQSIKPALKEKARDLKYRISEENKQVG
ncbi:MAG TPA: DUF2225 domain-containing protein [Syntrophomonadaceae bacterium]|nr:DUF2225 domain-containing protein [Syntrophomonadaceae bacterium]